MESSFLFQSFTTFVTEAVRLLGLSQILLALAALCAIGGVAVWVVSLVLCRKGGNVMPSITSSLMLALVSAMIGAVYLIQLLKSMMNPEDATPSALLYACTAIGVVLVFIAVQGGFATPAWKSIILAMVLVGSVAGAGRAAASFAFTGKPEQLNLLANQVTGRTSEGPWLVESAEATQRIKVARAPMEKSRIEARQGELLKTYQQLVAMKAQLNVNDAAAVDRFNKFAAVYSGETQALKVKLAEIQAILDEEARKEQKAFDEEDGKSE